MAIILLQFSYFEHKALNFFRDVHINCCCYNTSTQYDGRKFIRIAKTSCHDLLPDWQHIRQMLWSMSSFIQFIGCRSFFAIAEKIYNFRCIQSFFLTELFFSFLCLQNAVTHQKMYGNGVESVKFTWVAPPKTTENVKFYATIALNGGIYWVKKVIEPVSVVWFEFLI